MYVFLFYQVEDEWLCSPSDMPSACTRWTFNIKMKRGLYSLYYIPFCYPDPYPDPNHSCIQNFILTWIENTKLLNSVTASPPPNNERTLIFDLETRGKKNVRSIHQGAFYLISNFLFHILITYIKHSCVLRLSHCAPLQLHSVTFFYA